LFGSCCPSFFCGCGTSVFVVEKLLECPTDSFFYRYYQGFTFPSIQQKGVVANHIALLSIVNLHVITTFLLKTSMIPSSSR
jgi:hypothetical protein